ncbi:MAG TPA: CBS domain-containing protein, partial [bacterium]|nr:CBS domain-containing protein [bacterium]
GAYAMAGMAAVAGAAAQAPLTGIVIVFEITNDYAVILPVMICTMVAVIAAHELHQDSIYTHKLRRRGVDLAGALNVNLLKRVRVGDVLRREVTLIPQDLPFNFVVDLLLRSELSHLPVVDDHSAVVGLASRDLAKAFLGQRGLLSSLVLAADVMQRDPPLVTAQDTLDQAALLLRSHDLGEIYVVDDLQVRRIVGVVDKGTLMDAYRRELEKHETGDAFAYALNRPRGLEPVRLLDGYAILEAEAPHQFSGRSLRQLDLRNKYGVNVLAIKRREIRGTQSAWSVWVPESSQVLQDGDVLVLVGMTQRLESLQRGW